MAFVHKLIGPDEELIGVARLHWIYGAKGLAWLVGLMALGGFVDMFLTGWNAGLSPIGNAVFWVGTVLGVVLFAIYFITMVCSELGLTTERIIYKRGWIMVDVREMDLEEIKSESVDNGVLGRFLNYGYVKMDARFIEDVGLPAIAEPYRFIKAMNEARSNIKNDSMRVIIDQQRGKADNVAHGLRHLKEQQTQRLADNSSEKQDEYPHELSDERYEALSNDSEENAQQVKEDIKPRPENHVPSEQRPDLANGKKQKSREAKDPSQRSHHAQTENTGKQDSQEQADKKEEHKLFVHEEALHDKVIDDFEEAEEKTGS
jgi:hypothetical protein